MANTRNSSENGLAKPKDAIQPKQMAELIEFAAKTGEPLMFWGPPGIGKTALINSILTKLGFDEVRIIMTSWLDPTDLKGIPWLVMLKDGTTERKVTAWAPDKTWLMPEGKRVAYFFDEIPNAPPSITAAVQKLIHEKKVGDIDITGACIIAAGNNVTDAAGAQKMPTSVANRFIHFNVWPSLEDLTEYALEKGWHEWVVTYMRYRQKFPPSKGPWAAIFNFDPKTMDKGWVSPRTVEKVSTILQSNMSPEMKEVAIIGAVGEPWKIDFYTFLQVYNRLPDVDGILAGKAIKCPSEPDVNYALISALTGRLLHSSEEVGTKNGLTKEKFAGLVDNVIKYSLSMDPEFAVVLVRDMSVLQGGKIWRTIGFDYKLTPSFKDFKNKFKDIVGLTTEK